MYRILLSVVQVSQSRSKSFLRTLSSIGGVAVLAAGMGMPGYALEFPDTGDRGAPSTTAGGGTRSGWCEDDAIASTQGNEIALTALVPYNNINTFVGDQAALWIYGTPGVNQKTAEIFVQNAQTYEVIYQEQISIEGLDAGGLVRVELPANDASGAPLLEKNQEYKWEFAVICSSGDRSLDYHIGGLLQPVELDSELSSQLEAANPQEQTELYANAGIWQETLILAEQLRESAPELLPELLTSVGLSIDLEVLATEINAQPESVSSESVSSAP
ncbi:MAG: DUF928 domain-containing protein [Cyanobacteria bacterium J06621_3]